MHPVEELVRKADKLFEAAEDRLGDSLAESAGLFREGVVRLFEAFLLANDSPAIGESADLYRRCREIDPDFAAIAAEAQYLNAPVTELNEEDLADAANEIWDFVIDLISE